MRQILIRRIDSVAIERLRARAHRDGRSLAEECRLALVAAAWSGGLVEAAEDWRARWPAEEDEAAAFEDGRLRGPGRDVDLG